MTKQEKFISSAAKVANVGLAGAGGVSLLALLYVFYRYTWTRQNQFASPMGAMLYHVIPAALACLLFASLRLKPVHKITLAIFGLSLIASLYMGELLLGFIHTGPRKPVMSILMISNDKHKEASKLSKQFGVKIDTRDSEEIIADLSKQGIDAVPIVSPANHLFIEQPGGKVTSAVTLHGREIIPLGAISNKMTVLCNENGYYVTYESDQHGFNNPRDIWRSGAIEIAALGDSFAHGYCVPDEASFLSLIRRRYPATLNLSMAGNGPLLMLAAVNEYLRSFKPRIVLWFYFEGNDLDNLQTERRSDLLMRYLEDGFTQGLVGRQNDIDRAIVADMVRQEALERKNRAAREQNSAKSAAKILEFTKLSAVRKTLGLVDGTNSQELEKLADLGGANIDRFRDILSQAKTRVNTWGGKLHFVYLPDWPRYKNSDPGPFGRQRPQVFKLVEALGIPIIDVHPIFQAQSDPLSIFPFREPGHYNEKGHEIVARQVLEALSAGTQQSTVP